MSGRETSSTRKITLEPFSAHLAPAAFQAIKVSGLIRSEKHWLEPIQPGTVRRYEQPAKAHRNIMYIAGSSALKAYIVHYGSSAALGLATVIRGQNVIHPEAGLVEGDDVDYWLKLNSPIGAHLAVVGKLSEMQEIRPTFATVRGADKQAAQKAVGFERYMTTVGQPAVLSTNTPGDPYEVARAGAVSQVYQML